MDYDTFKVTLETIIEDQWSDDYDHNITVIISRLARRAVQLRSEFDFTLDDIVEELTEITSNDIENDWDDIISEFALIVYDELESGDLDSLEDED